MEFLTQRIRELEARRQLFREARSIAARQARQHYTRRAIGANGAWLLGRSSSPGGRSATANRLH